MSGLSRKHFRVFAENLKASKPAITGTRAGTNDRKEWCKRVRTTVDLCRSANPRFDLTRFLDACDTTENELSRYGA